MMTLAEIVENRVKDAGAALKAYEDVLEKDATHREALERGRTSRRGARRLGQGRERAREDPRDRAGADAVAVALRLAKAREEHGDDAGVEQALKRALEADPKQPDVRARLGQLYEKTKNWGELAQLLVGNADILRDENPYTPPATQPRQRPPLRGGVDAAAARRRRRAGEAPASCGADPPDGAPARRRTRCRSSSA